MIQVDGGWMFLSHSNKDFELVRQIRNTLEDKGFRPIAFYLKCLTDSDELDDLIKREIAARRWFVFVASENSRNSNWVKEELAYARELNKKVYTIDLTQALAPQLDKIISRTTVFMSHSQSDQELAALFGKALLPHDFQIWSDDTLYFTERWPLEMEKQIKSADFCLLLITDHAIASHHVRVESYYTFSQKRPVLAIMVGDVHIPSNLDAYLSQLPHVRVSNPPTEAELAHVTETIIQMQENRDL